MVPTVLAEAVACEKDAYSHKSSHHRRHSKAIQQDDLDLDLQIALQYDIHSNEEEAALRNSSDHDNSTSLDSDEQDVLTHKVFSFGCSSIQDAPERFMRQSKGKFDSLFFILLQTIMGQSQLESLQPFDIPSRPKLSALIKQSPAWKEAYSVNEVEAVRRIRKASIEIKVADRHPSCFNIMTFAEQITLNGVCNDAITVQIGRKYADMIRANLVQQLEIRQCHLLCLFASISKYSNAAVMRLASENQKVKNYEEPSQTFRTEDHFDDAQTS